MEDPRGRQPSPRGAMSQPCHMTPCACHCAACRAAGHGNGACVVLCAGLHDLLDGKADVVDEILRQYHGAHGWGTARFDAAIHCVQYGPTGDVIVAGGADNNSGQACKPQIHLICAQTGERISSGRLGLTGHWAYVRSISWAPDGKRLASGSNDKTVRIWEVATGTELSQLTGHSDPVRSVSWAPDGIRLASGSNDGTVRIWEAATGKELSRLRQHKHWVISVSFSPDGTRLASGSADKTVKIWNSACSWEALWTLGGHTNYVLSVAWSPDSTRLASGSSDKTVKIWDPATGVCLSTLKGHSG